MTSSSILSVNEDWINEADTQPPKVCADETLSTQVEKPWSDQLHLSIHPGFNSTCQFCSLLCD